VGSPPAHRLPSQARHGATAVTTPRCGLINRPPSVIESEAPQCSPTQALAGLGALRGAEPDARRFRPNLLVDAVGASAFPEDDWVGSVLRIGEARMRVDQRDRRCAVVTVDPSTAARNPEVLRVIARARQGYLGVYGSTVRSGRIAVGDPVVIER
jgi:uncharacterized protein YcbX